MATKHTFKYQGSVTPAATSFLKSEPIDMKFEIECDLETSDQAVIGNIQKKFQSTLADYIKGQQSHLDKWLKEKHELLDTMVKRANELKAKPLPTDQGAVAAYAKIEKEVQDIGKQTAQWKTDYQKIVADWAENCREQQGRLAINAALKDARQERLADKSMRVKAGIAVKGVLLLLGVAAAIAAVVLTAGATAPIFVGLAAAGIALTGVSGLAGIGKTIKENIDVEKKILASAEKDVQGIQQAFGGMKDKSSNIRKHVTELGNLVLVRDDHIKKLDGELPKYRAEIKKYEDAIAKLQGSPIVNEGDLKKKQTALAEVKKGMDTVTKKIATLKSDNQKARDLLMALNTLGISLDKIGAEGPNSLIGNLKQRYSGLDGWVDLGGALGGLASGASGLHS